MRPGVQVGNYVLLAELARGGFGTVFRARGPDGREVALKLLHVQAGGAAGDDPTESAGERARFLREAQALCRLRHPHVLQALDAGSAGQQLFLVTELVEGETLRARLARDGRLSATEAVSIVAKLALALEHVHARGLLHRDLKPGNVLLRRDGEPVLIDFGLTRGLDATLVTRVTEGGDYLGTPGYCAPEQARGELERVGPAADVYGLGALLVELLTGAPPYGRAQSPVEAMLAQERPPPPPSRARPGLDPALDAICLRALERDPARRHASAAALAAELQAWERAGPRPAGRGALLGALGLGLLAGGGAVWLARVTPAPGSAASAAPPTTQGVASAPDGPGPHGAAPPASSLAVSRASRDEAQACYQRGLDRRREGDLAGAEAEYERALALDPGHALAHLNRGGLRFERGDLAGARDDFQRAQELDPGLALAWVNLGVVATREGDRAAARAHLERALEIDPALALAWANRAVLHAEGGDLEGARADYDRAIALDPGDARARANRARLRRDQGDAMGALADLDGALACDPRDVATLSDRGLLRWHTGDEAGALRDLDRALELDPDYGFALHNRALVLTGRGDHAGALRDLDRLVQLARDPAARARALAGRGDARLAAGDPQGAEADFAAALGEAPRHAGAWSGRAEARERRGDAAGALQDYERVLELDPRETRALVRRGVLRGQAGDLPAALRDWERARELLPAGTPEREEVEALLRAARGE